MIPTLVLAVMAAAGLASVVASIAITIRAARTRPAEQAPPAASVAEGGEPASDPQSTEEWGATLLAVAVVAILLCGITGVARIASSKSLQERESPVRAELTRDFPGFEVVTLSRRYQRGSSGKPTTESFDFMMRLSAVPDFKLVGTYHLLGPGIDAGSRLSRLPRTLFDGKKLSQKEVRALANVWVERHGGLPVTVGSRRYGAVIRPSILATQDPVFTAIGMRTDPRGVYGFLAGPRDTSDVYWLSFDRKKGTWANLGGTADLQPITTGP